MKSNKHIIDNYLNLQDQTEVGRIRFQILGISNKQKKLEPSPALKEGAEKKGPWSGVFLTFINYYEPIFPSYI